MEGGKGSLPTEVFLLPGIPSFFKMECQPGARSPITILLSRLDTDRIKGLEVYGSFSNKEPSEEDNCLHLKDPKKIEIFDPKRKKKFASLVTVKEREGKTKKKLQMEMTKEERAKEE